MAAAPAPRRSMFALLVLSGVIISICMGLRQSLGLFMLPMTLALGISAATFGFAIALQNIVWGLSQPVVGALADRYGPRPVLIGTALMYAAGLLLMVRGGGGNAARGAARPAPRWDRRKVSPVGAIAAISASLGRSGACAACAAISDGRPAPDGRA